MTAVICFEGFLPPLVIANEGDSDHLACNEMYQFILPIVSSGLKRVIVKRRSFAFSFDTAGADLDFQF